MMNDKKFLKKIKRAKIKSRPDLKFSEWSKKNYYENFDLNNVSINENIDRIDYNSVSLEEFINNYELPCKPCIITNAQNDWPAKTKWTLEYFEVGEDNEGYSVVLKMKYYKQYIQTNTDDSPLYLFDSCFSEHNKKNKLLKHYKVPVYFQEDLFELVERKRPPYRWFVMGPPRSGTGIHIDPLGTSAWNALVTGHKRWCLFPTQTPRELLKLTKFEAGKQADEGITWFKEKYPQVISELWPQEFKPIECVQKPGEIIFVPCGWWHVVLNMDLTIAITQNYCSTQNFPVVWHKTVRGRTGYAKKWYKELKNLRPDLADIADKIDPYSDIGMQSDSGDEKSTSSSISSCSSESDQTSKADEDDEDYYENEDDYEIDEDEV